MTIWGILSQITLPNDMQAAKNSQHTLLTSNSASELAPKPGQVNLQIKNINFLREIIKPLEVCKDKVVCCFDPTGFEIVHEIPGVYQLRIFLAKEEFDDYEFFSGPKRKEKFLFALSMEHFANGVNFFSLPQESKQKSNSLVLPLRIENHDRSLRHGSKPSGELFISYYEDTGNLLLNSSSGNLFGEFCLVTYECSPLSASFFHPTASMASIVIKSYCVKEALLALDHQCERVELSFSPEYPHFSVSGIGATWEVETHLSNYNEICDSFHCINVIKARYRYTHIMTLIPGLKSAEKIFVCINDQGFLSVKFIDGQNRRIETAEFIVCCFLFYSIYLTNVFS
ncbi:ssDNA endodeoxyribonuclease, variant 2 [Entomophthora muscae]|uniref:SsDNA endodeoxyribonuclease, variant 2 n=1 Tax=Entomophthora muscae TaxID=34485 RepID=A0ACC2S8N7_9FUNG|nr:ssDNA endodeoxyribonuclease, variant 2 [Entomophthora muscae]